MDKRSKKEMYSPAAAQEDMPVVEDVDIEVLPPPQGDNDDEYDERYPADESSIPQYDDPPSGGLDSDEESDLPPPPRAEDDNDNETFDFITDDYSVPAPSIKTQETEDRPWRKPPVLGPVDVDDVEDYDPQLASPMSDGTQEPPVYEVTQTPTSTKPNQDFSIGVERRILRAVEKRYHSDERRSPDLVPLSKKYYTFKKELGKLISSIKTYRKATASMQTARSKLFDGFADFSRGTPLFEHIGELLEQDEFEQITHGDESARALSTSKQSLELKSDVSANQIHHYEGVLSLISVQQFAGFYEKRRAEEFEHYVLGYAKEWEQIVCSKLDSEMKTVQNLQGRKTHYERKLNGIAGIGGLRKRVSNIEDKGKEVPISLAEKLKRNEEKLRAAWEKHEQRASQLCILLEEVTDQGWKDLYPLVKNCMRAEILNARSSNVAYGRLKDTLDAMRAKSFEAATISPNPSPTKSNISEVSPTKSHDSASPTGSNEDSYVVPASALESYDEVTVINGKSMVVLLSTTSSDLAERQNQKRALLLLDSNGINPEIVDASEMSLRDLRDELFEVSGIQGDYPQIFLKDTANGSHAYWGSLDTLEGLLEHERPLTSIFHS